MDDQTWNWLKRGYLIFGLIVSIIHVVTKSSRVPKGFTHEELFGYHRHVNLSSLTEIKMEDTAVLTFKPDQWIAGWRVLRGISDKKMHCFGGMCLTSPKKVECINKGMDQNKSVTWACNAEMEYFQGFVFGLDQSSVICQEARAAGHPRLVFEESCVLVYTLQLIVLTRLAKLVLIAAIAYGIYEQIMLKMSPRTAEEKAAGISFRQRSFLMGRRVIPVIFKSLAYLIFGSILSYGTDLLARHTQTPLPTDTITFF